MEGVQAYKVPVAKATADVQEPEQGQIIEIGGIAYVWYPKHSILMNMQGASTKFQTWGDVEKALGGES